MVKPTDLVVWLHDVDKHDTLFVGGKGANLGEMIQAKFPVPTGFVTTSYAYFDFIRKNNLDVKIRHLLGTIDYKNSSSLAQVASHIRKLIKSSEIPEEIVKNVFSYYAKMGGNPLVAIRSSATSEDSKAASFAGQNETFLNIKGESSLIEKIREAWSSLFEARSVFYRNENKIDHLKTGIALVVQKMVESDVSGVMFTVDPVTGSKEKVIIESIYGLGEYIVQGTVTPDHYEVYKKSGEITERKIADQTIMFVKADIGNEEKKVPLTLQNKQKITDHQILEIAKLGIALEKHYYFPQDIEWAIEKNKIFIVQTRPITTIGMKSKEQEKRSLQFLPSTGKQILLAKGDPASPGIGIGHARILKSPKEISKVLQGDVLVAPFTSPDYVPAMKRASAIVTERGGRTSHAAIVSREFGIPAVVGAENATKAIKENEVITVNGTTGEIYKGSIVTTTKNVPHEEEVTYKTKTHLLVNLGQPELAEKVAQKNVDGVGLLRAEFMIAGIGTHPRKLIKEKKQKIFIEKLAEGLESFCSAFYPRSVLYRATDFKTNEYRNLIGGKEFEPTESNPMLGYRGAFRYVHDAQVFNLELEAIKQVRKKYDNLDLMIPFVRTPKELEEVKKMVTASGLRRTHNFKLIMMVEIPSNVILLEEFIKVGIDGVSIGSNDLTMLLLGLDRDNEEVAVEFNERDPAVLWALEKVIRTCRKHHITSSICGQAPSVYPDLVEKLVEWGVTSISVAPDAIDNTRRIIHDVEKNEITYGKD